MPGFGGFVSVQRNSTQWPLPHSKDWMSCEGLAQQISDMTQQQYYLFENPTTAACIVMHALATLILTKVPVKTGY